MNESTIEAGGVRPRTIGALLDFTFRLYRERFGFVMLTSVVMLLPYWILNTLATFHSTTLFQSVLTQIGNQSAAGAPPSQAMVGQLVTTSGLVVLLSILDWAVVLPLLYGALLRMAVGQTLERREVTFSQAVLFSFRRWMTVIGTLVLIWLVGAAFVLVVGVLIGLAAAALSGASQAMAVAVVAVIGVAAMVIGVWISVRLSMVSSVIREERTRLWRSVKRSWELTRGNFWRSFWFFVLVWIIVLVLSSGLTGGAGLLRNPVLSAIVTAIVSFLLTPFEMLATANLYVDLRIRTDALDLADWLPTAEQDVDG